MWWPPYVFFLTCYSAWRLSFWLLNVCLLLLLTPGFLIQNSARSLQRRTGRPSSLVMSGKAWHVVRSVLPPKWQARHSPPLEDHPSGKKKISYRRGESISLFFLFPFLPLLRESSERTTELGSMGEHPWKYLFHVIFLFCFKFTKVRNCLFTKNSYQKTFPLPSECGSWRERGRWGVGESWVLT